MRKISKIYVHHSALPRSKSLPEIRELHLARGFKDIGYHFIIDGEGRILEGRQLEEEGAHVKGDNVDSIGICVCGNFEEEQPFPSQIEALEKLISSLCERFERLQILGHRDYPEADTLCPGHYLYQLLPELRRKTNLKSGDKKPRDFTRLTQKLKGKR